MQEETRVPAIRSVFVAGGCATAILLAAGGVSADLVDIHASLVKEYA
jgi:hypothetical protein